MRLQNSMQYIPRILEMGLLPLAVFMCVSVAWGQSADRGETGANPGDLQLSGPANLSGESPAPAAEIELPSLDDTITKGAPKSQDVDSFIAGGVTPIDDPERETTDREMTASKADLTPREVESDPPAPPSQDNGEAANYAPRLPAANISKVEERVARLEQLIELQSEILAELKDNPSQLAGGESLRPILQDELEKFAQKLESRTERLRPTPDVDPGNTPRRPDVGVLVVENLTGVTYTLNVNGYDVVVLPGRQEVPVEVGNMVTEIRGFEAPRAWNASNF